MRQLRRTLRSSGLLGAGLATLLLGAARPAPAQGEGYRERALRLLRTVPLIDGHNDIPDAIRARGGVDSVDFAAPQPKLMTDVPRLRAGEVGGQFWAAYVPVTTIHAGEHPAVYALEQIDLVHRLCGRYRQTLADARTAGDVERNFAAGKISCLIGIEGGHAIENSLGALRMFSALGVRYMTLTHWETIDWADAATDSARHNGLTPFGEEVVREMNRLGMLVDISHVSDKTFYDVLALTTKPVIASHSSCRALANIPRNMTDDMLKALAKNGGVIGINFGSGFLNPKDAERTMANINAMKAQEPDLTGKPLDDYAMKEYLSQDWAHPKPAVATIDDVVAHIDRVVKVAGIDHVGIGTDFDGIPDVPKGLEDVSKMPALTAALLKRGYSEADIGKIMGGNFLRVMKQVIGK